MQRPASAVQRSRTTILDNRNLQIIFALFHSGVIPCNKTCLLTAKSVSELTNQHHL